MKKILVLLALVSLLVTVVSAANENSDKGNKDGIQGQNQAINAINNSMQNGNPSDASIQARLRVIERLQQKISEEKDKVDNETNNRDKTKEFKNQNVVRERVMSLLALRNMTEDRGIGQEVAEVARQFNNSINKTQGAEERMNNRGWFQRFLFGGDDTAANEIEPEVKANRARIAQLKELRKGTSEEIGQFIDEQLKELDVEQNRLQGLAQREKESKGIFGWLYK
ncbi:MAG: hypothetical protein V1875_08380 [Candidatus Altiarchaeota archaeon]